MLRKLKSIWYFSIVILLTTFLVVCLLLWWDSRLLLRPKRCPLCPETSLLPTRSTEKLNASKELTTNTAPTLELTTTKPIINNVDFKFVYPHVTPDIQGVQDIFLVVFVNSAAKGHRVHRDTVRKTWGSHDTCEQRKAMGDQKLKNLTWLLVFVLGRTGSHEDEENIKEAKEHNDMVIGDIKDNYINNIIKYYMGLLWSSNWAPKYILKTDDDAYVRIPGLLKYFLNQGFPNRYYGGETYGVSNVHRGGKWAVSKEIYPEKTWPKFNAGAFIAISSDLVASLLNYVKHRKPLHTDDAYVGVAMRDLKITIRDIPSFYIHDRMNELVRTNSDCEILKLVGFAHNVDPKSSEFLHGRLERMCSRNFTRASC